MSGGPAIEPTSVRDPLMGARLGDYEVIGPLGEGGMGVVYEGLHTVINKRVAIKVIKAEYAGDQVLVRRVLAEAQAVNAVRHRGIVDIHAHGLTPDGRPYLVMEMLHGETLYDLLVRKGRLPFDEAVSLLLEATGPLFAAHKAGIVHRDLKPSNLFLCKEDDGERFLKLLDFGLAKRSAPGVTSSTMTSASLIVGTPDYMAPEQARAQPTDARTDIYSLGVLAFEMLAGRLPYTASTSVDLVMQHLAAPVPRILDFDPNLPRDLSELVEQMMAKEPAKRPQTLEPVRALLKKHAALNAAYVARATPAFALPVPESVRESSRALVREQASQPIEAPLASEPELPRADRTVITAQPETPRPEDVGTADTAMSLKQVRDGRQTEKTLEAPRLSGTRRKPASSGTGAPVVEAATAREKVLTSQSGEVAPVEDSVRPASTSRTPFIVGGVLVGVILVALGVLFASQKPDVAQPVVPVVPPKDLPVVKAPPVVTEPVVTPPPTAAIDAGAVVVAQAVEPPKKVEPDPKKVEPKVVERPKPPPPVVRRAPSVEELATRIEALKAKAEKAGNDLTRTLLERSRRRLTPGMSEDERKVLKKDLDELEKQLR